MRADVTTHYRSNKVQAEGSVIQGRCYNTIRISSIPNAVFLTSCSGGEYGGYFGYNRAEIIGLGFGNMLSASGRLWCPVPVVYRGGARTQRPGR